MESTVLFHHATETLLRLFFAHRGSPKCPWVEIVDISTPKEFKEQSQHILTHGLDRKEVAHVFLGGPDKDSASIELTSAEFDAAIDAYIELMNYCATRYLADSFVYNAAKHGLSGVPLDNIKFAVQFDEDQNPIELMGGTALASLQKKAIPTQPSRKHQAEWYAALTNVLSDQDLLITQMIGRAIESLWAVAKRQYLGVPGQIYIFDKTAVQALIFEPVRAAGQYVRAVIYELPTLTTYTNGNTKLSEIQVNMHPSLVPREYVEASHPSGDRTVSATPRLINLPLRQQDIREEMDGTEFLLPFSPTGTNQNQADSQEN
ncbi:hypothetical protein [Nocardia asiatica]